MSVPRTVVQYSLCGPLPKNLESFSLYELNDRQSQTCRRGYHCWELQDEPFAFCGLVGIAWIFSTGSSARIWSVFCCVRPSRNENQH